MPVVVTPRQRRRSHRSIPLLVGIALLSMAAGARHGLPATTTVVPSGSSASVLSAPADLPVQDAAVPAGFVVDLADARDTVRPSTIEGVEAGSDRWDGTRAAAPATVAAVTAALSRQETPATQQPHSQFASVRTSVPATLGSRAPPTA
jgi:hypothetical protein